MDCSSPGSSVHGILQARILEWVAISFSRGFSQPRDRTWVSCTGGRFFTDWATREAQIQIINIIVQRLLKITGLLTALKIVLDLTLMILLQFSSVAQSCPTLWDPMDCSMPSPCPTPTPRACPNSCPSSQWCHPTIWSSVLPFSSCLQSFQAAGSFPMSHFFASGGQNIGASFSASVPPVNIQDWFPSEWIGWISSQSKGLSRLFSNTTV